LSEAKAFLLDAVDSAKSAYDKGKALQNLANEFRGTLKALKAPKEKAGESTVQAAGITYAIMIGPVPFVVTINPAMELAVNFTGGFQFTFLYGVYFGFSVDTGFEYTKVNKPKWYNPDTGMRTWKEVSKSMSTIGPDMSLKLMPAMLRVEVRPLVDFTFYGFVTLTLKLPLRFQADLGWCVTAL